MVIYHGIDSINKSPNKKKSKSFYEKNMNFHGGLLWLKLKNKSKLIGIMGI